MARLRYLATRYLTMPYLTILCAVPALWPLTTQAQTAPAPVLAGQPQAATPPLPAAKPKLLCRTEEVTGSLFKKRSCHTKEEWTEIDGAHAADKEDFRRMITTGTTANPGH